MVINMYKSFVVIVVSEAANPAEFYSLKLPLFDLGRSHHDGNGNNIMVSYGQLGHYSLSVCKFSDIIPILDDLNKNKSFQY